MMKKSFFLNIIKKYRFKSLFVKLFLSVFVILVLPLSVLAFEFVHTYYTKSDQQFRNTCFSTGSYISYEIDNMLRTADAAIQKLCLNSIIMTYLTTDEPQQNKVAKQSSTFIELSEYLTLDSGYMDSIYLYKTGNQYVLSKKISAYADDFPDMLWYDIYCRNNKMNSFFGREATLYEGKRQYFSVCSNIFSGDDIVGVLVFNFDLDKLISYAKSYGGTEISISNYDRKTVYSTNEDKVGEELLISNETETSGEDFTTSEQLLSKNGYVKMSFSNIAYTGQRKLYTLMIVLIVCIVIFAALIISYVISYNFYRSIYMIIQTFHNTFDDDSSDNEYQYICNNIMNIKSSISNYEEDLSEKISQLKKAQINSMQMQINPHFIFNTLNLICTMEIADKKADTKLSKTVRLLSDILRDVMNNKENVTEFRHELDYVIKYIELQNIKYNGKFDFVQCVDSHTLDLTCTKFLLQPIVENAIQHGMTGNFEGKFKIKLSAAKVDKIFIIEIFNNGRSIDKKRLEEINESLKNEDVPEAPHIGLANTNFRIKMIFGSQYGIKLFSDDEGVTVKVTLPAIPYSKDGFKELI